MSKSTRITDRSSKVAIAVPGEILRKPTFELAPAEFTRIYETHVTGSLRCSQAAGHLFREYNPHVFSYAYTDFLRRKKLEEF